ncbi:MAG: sigma factor [Rubripirellula sp.]
MGESFRFFVPKRLVCDSKGIRQLKTLFWSPIVEEKARQAFEILARENSRMLMVYLRSLVRDQAAVDDLFQESMVVAWQRLAECELDRPFGPWLRGIASRLVFAHYRKQKTDPLPLHESVLHIVDRDFENISLLAGKDAQGNGGQGKDAQGNRTAEINGASK